jgi:hypothetical protein
VHHHGADEALNDGAGSFAESLGSVAASGVGKPDSGLSLDLNVILDRDVSDGDILVGPEREAIMSSAAPHCFELQKHCKATQAGKTQQCCFCRVGGPVPLWQPPRSWATPTRKRTQPSSHREKKTHNCAHDPPPLPFARAASVTHHFPKSLGSLAN